MKKTAAYCGLFFLQYSVFAQPLIIKGQIKCVQNTNSTKGAENIIVVPAFMPSKATETITRPSGYFEFNTGVPVETLQDKIVSVYVISRCSNCKEIVKRVFVSEDQDRQNRNDDKRYVTIKDWMLNANCQAAELRPFAVDSILAVVIKQPAQDLGKVSAATALTGTPAFLNFIANVTAVAGVASFPVGDITAKSLSPGKINYGNFLLASPLFHSANTGFNFSPARDMSEAMFWNPSAIANARKPYNISLLTNIKNNGKLGGYLKLNERISLGAGFIYTMQDEFRKSIYTYDIGGTNNTIDSTAMKLKEYAAFISPVYKVNKQFSVALTIKSVWQHFNIPFKGNIGSAEVAPNKGPVTFTDSTINKQHFDFDVSASYKITSSLQVGINLMNLAGTKLYADAFVAGQANRPVQQQRSLGLGITYKWQRFNVGVDGLFTKDGFYDAAFGVNYVPFNNALISAGLSVKQLSYSFAFRIKYFRIAYINDNDWLINEKRKGKSGIMNGHIYGGFIFDLN